MIALGILGKPFGFKGEVHFYPYNEKTQSLIVGQEFFIRKNSGISEKKTLESCRAKNSTFILKFSGCDSKEEVALMTNCALVIDRKKLPLLPEGEFYLEDLLHFDVFEFDGEFQDEFKDKQENKLLIPIGKVEKFSFNHADQTILHIASKSYPQLEVLLHPFVKKVDLQNRRCYIIIPDYAE